MEDITLPSPLTLLALTFSILLSYLLLSTLYTTHLSPLSSIPGPPFWSASRLPFLFSLARGNLSLDLQRLHKEHGPVLRIAPDEVTFSHPDAWRDIFHLSPGKPQFLKHPTWWRPLPGIPKSLVWCIDPDEHAFLKRCFAPGYSARAMKVYERVISENVDVLVRRIREIISAGEKGSGGEVDVMRWFNYLTFDVIGEIAYGESFGCLEGGEYHEWISLIFDHVKAIAALVSIRFFPWVERVLVAILPLVVNAQGDHFQLIVDKVKRRLGRDVDAGADMLSFVAIDGVSNFAGDGKKGISMESLNASMMELMIAGSESTAGVLSGAVVKLIQNPEKLGILVGEIRSRFEGLENVTFEALRELHYLDAVIKEALRLAPPLQWIASRQVPKGGAVVCGKLLPGGTAVSISMSAMHRNPTSFYEADSFRPERWLVDATTNPQSPYFHDRRDAVKPFISGSRTCSGQQIAWAEIRMTLAKVLWSFDFPLPQDWDKRIEWKAIKSYLVLDKVPINVNFKVRE
ncbi:cytochrome P450 [Immersiella caudata]|uniref:Cytochrome P450 n=1 Tax=Immersiella caudata TaxID=314043 RepID=A0AA39XHR3_9PEZI|nr:cytochrome P450 [Immersiella caudata]